MVHVIAFAVHFQVTPQKESFCLYTHGEPVSPRPRHRTWGVFTLLIIARLIGEVIISRLFSFACL